MKLYRWGPSYQYHYVVANSFGDAEATIKTKYCFGGLENDQIEQISQYVQISRSVLDEIIGKDKNAE